MAATSQKALFGLCFQELTEIIDQQNQPSYRARQLYQAMYAERLASLEKITTLPRQLREALAESGYALTLPEIKARFVSDDGTIRYLLTLGDGETVETVWMPEGDGDEAGDGSEENELDTSSGHHHRATICVSSQVGCAVNCQFCMTALMGLKRNLNAGEIVGQVATVLNERCVDVQCERINLVFMGQGEPFLNYENFMKAVRLLADPEGVGIPASRMTVSTSGIVPRIYDFGKEEVRPKLAISLNASTDEVRSRLMPLNRKWDLEKLITAARDLPLRPREKLTFEYVLLSGVNDDAAHAREVAELLRGLRAKVNLIALNPGPEIPFSSPGESRVANFQNILRESGLPAYVRRPRGRDIYAACGQLKRMAG